MRRCNSIKNDSMLVKELWVIQESDGAFKKVAKLCEQNGKLLKKNPLSRISCLEEQVEKGDFATEAKEAIYYERLYSTKLPSSGYKYASWETDGKRFVISHKATRFYKGKPVFEIEDKHLSNGWKTTLKVWPLAKKIHTPPDSGWREANIASALKELREGDKKLEAEYKEYTIEKDRKWLSPPILVKRYAHRKNLNIVELGPSCRAKVPRSLLKKGSGNSYTGLDLGLSALQKQQELLKEEGGYIALHSKQLVGDFYNAPIKSESADLIVAIGSLPFSCIRREEKNYIDVTNEIARLLKKDGEFVLNWAALEDASPAAVAHLLDLFSLIDSDGEGTSRTLVFRKR